MHGRFLLFNSSNLGHSRATMKMRGQFVELSLITGRINLHPAVIFIANPAANPYRPRVFLHEITESNALNSPGNVPAPRFRPGLQEFDS